MSTHDLSQLSTSGLLALERDHAAAEQLEACMRAAHSLKGAARIVDLADGVRVAHAMEDCFVAAQHGRLVLGRGHIDILLSATDLMARIAGTGGQSAAAGTGQKEVEACLTALARVLATPETPPTTDNQQRSPDSPPQPAPAGPGPAPDNPDRVLRV